MSRVQQIVDVALERDIGVSHVGHEVLLGVNATRVLLRPHGNKIISRRANSGTMRQHTMERGRRGEEEEEEADSHPGLECKRKHVL